MWRFVAFGGKKCEAEAGAYTDQDMTFRRRFAASDEKTASGTTAFYGGKCKRTVLPSWQTDHLWLLVKHK